MSLERQSKFPRRELQKPGGGHGPLPRASSSAGTLEQSRGWRLVVHTLLPGGLFHYVVLLGLPSLTQGDLWGSQGESAVISVQTQVHLLGSVSPVMRGFSVGSTSCQVDFANWEDHHLDPQTIAPWFVSLFFGTYVFA